MAVGSGVSSAIILLTSIFLPPLGIFLLKGCGPEVIIGICLTILAWFPGMIYAVYLWMQDGGFQKSSVAETRIERVKERYRELRTKTHSEGKSKTTTEVGHGKQREPLTAETTASQGKSSATEAAQNPTERVSPVSLPARQAHVIQAYPRPTSSQAIRADIPQIVTEVIEVDNAPKVLPTSPPAPSVGSGEDVVPYTAAQSALTDVASQSTPAKGTAKVHKNIPGFYRGLFASKKPRGQASASSEHNTAEGVLNQITTENHLPSPGAEHVVEAPVAVPGATNVNPVI